MQVPWYTIASMASLVASSVLAAPSLSIWKSGAYQTHLPPKDKKFSANMTSIAEQISSVWPLPVPAPGMQVHSFCLANNYRQDIMDSLCQDLNICEPDNWTINKSLWGCGVGDIEYISLCSRGVGYTNGGPGNNDYIRLY